MPEESQIRVLVVDDHTIVREGLVTLLEAVPDLQLVGEAASGSEAIHLCAEGEPDVVLMDLVMPGMGGVTAIRAILADNPEIQVLALTSFREKELVQGALEAGAVGYLLKNISADELARAIRMASRGEPTIAPEATQALIDVVTGSPPLGHDLTEREHQVLELLVKGLSNAQIARQLGITSSTVKNHVSHIFSKLDVSTRTEAATLALKEKIVHMA